MDRILRFMQLHIYLREILFLLSSIIKKHLKLKNRLYGKKLTSSGLDFNISKVIHNFHDGAKSCVEMNDNYLIAADVTWG